MSEPTTAREWLQDETVNNVRYRFRLREKGALWDTITVSVSDPEHMATVVRVSHGEFTHTVVPLDQPIIVEPIPTWREAQARRRRALGLTAEEPIGSVLPESGDADGALL